MKNLLSKSSLFLFVITILIPLNSYPFIIVNPENNWNFYMENPDGSLDDFVPFGTNYWDPETYVWVGIYDPFEDYDGGVNTCAGQFDLLSNIEWVTISKNSSNDHILIYPPPGDYDNPNKPIYNFTIDLKYENPIELKDIFDGYFENGYSDGVYVEAGKLSENKKIDQLVVSTMSQDDIVLIFFYDNYIFNELNKIEIPGVEGYNDGVKIACGDYDGDGLDELAITPFYSSDEYNSIRIFKLDENDQPYLWNEITYPRVINDISIAAGRLDINDPVKNRQQVVFSGVMQGSGSLKHFPQVYICRYSEDEENFEISYMWTETFDREYEGGINIACGKIDLDKDNDFLITSSKYGQDSIRIYEFNPDTKRLDYLKNEDGHIKGRMDDIFADVYENGLTVSTARLSLKVADSFKYRDHILIGSSDFKDAVMFRDYHPEWPNNDGWHNYGRFYITGKYDTYRNDKYLKILKETNINIIKVMLSPGVFIDDNDNLYDVPVKQLKEFIHLAEKHGFMVLLSMCNWWELWPNSWTVSNIFSDFQYTLDRQKAYFSQMTYELRNEENIFGYNIFDEPNIEWGERDSTNTVKNQAINKEWNKWLGNISEGYAKYKSEDEWRRAWGDDVEEIDEWDPSGFGDGYVYPPKNEFDPGNRKLFDYQLFREYVAARWVEEISNSIKLGEGENGHLIQSPGMWVFSTALFPNSWGYSPATYSAFNPLKIKDFVDFYEMHLYPWSYGVGHFTEDELAYAEAVSRYCYFGKPVISADFGCDNFINYADDFFRATESFLSGWLNWDAYETDDTGWINRNISLIDAARQLTPLGEYFKSFLGNYPYRAEATSYLVIDMLSALTDINTSYNYTQTAKEMIKNGETIDIIQDYPCTLIEGSITPQSGDTNTDFVFEVRCIDQDYAHPDKIYVSVFLEKTGEMPVILQYEIDTGEDNIPASSFLDDVFQSQPVKIDQPADSFIFFFFTKSDADLSNRAWSLEYNGGNIDEAGN